MKKFLSSFLANNSSPTTADDYLLDASSNDLNFLWDNASEKILARGAAASQKLVSPDQQLFKPFKFGILQSTWALTESWRSYWSQLASEKKYQRIKVLLPAANSSLERSAVKAIISEISFRPVTLIDRASFLNDYLLREKNFSKLKLILDLSDDFIEISLFLDQKKIKSSHLNWGLSHFDQLANDFCLDNYGVELLPSQLIELRAQVLANQQDKQLVLKAKDLGSAQLKSVEINLVKLRKIYQLRLEKLIAALELFIFDLAAEFFNQDWHSFYLFLPASQCKFLLETLSQALHLEGIHLKGVISSYD